MPTITLAQVADLLECPLPSGATGTLVITAIANPVDAGPGELTFVGNKSFLKQLENSRSPAAIIHKSLKPSPAVQSRIALLPVDDPDLAVAKVLRKLAPPIPRPPVGLDSWARIDPSAHLEPDVAIGPFAVIGARVTVGRGTIIHPGVIIGDDVAIGPHCELFPHVVLRERITIGQRVIIHAGSVLGTDGFGYRWDGAQHAKIPQIGTIVIEDDVEIGSCVCVDRAKFGATRIGRGTKIDNLVQVAHNVVIGPHSIIVGQAGLAGSVRLGTGAVLGGQAAIRDHVSIGDGAMVAARAAVVNDVKPGEIVSGAPALPHRQSLREQAAFRRLPDLVQKVRHLEEQIAQLQSKSAPK
jgi:UDP-3-O-[3-hydroxymyristoyl] glucosamine N-acyltransferase